MTEAGTIKRNNQTLPYFYYIEKNAFPLERISINWARLWLEKHSKSWERIVMDYNTSTCTVINTATGKRKDIRIIEKGFKLPGEHILLVSDDSVNRWKEDLLCGK